ncbi:hypothetical protein [Blastococcus sp. SYSU DS0539]
MRGAAGRSEAKPARDHFDRWTLAIALAAFVVSFGGVAVAFSVKTAEDERLRMELARQVVFVVVEGEPQLGAPGSKPPVGEAGYVVANFGPFPVEEVVIETGPESVVAPVPGVTETLDPVVEAVRIGTLGPCQSASISGREYRRVLFTDVEGVRWSRGPAEPPTEQLPDEDVRRNYPDIRTPAQWELGALDHCG